MKDFYQMRLGHLMSPEIMWGAAIVFYIVYTIGLMFFATLPGIESGTLTQALILGAAFGFFAYATYDLTNQATLNNWPLVVTIVDIAWGTFLGACISGLGFFIHTSFFSN